MQNDMRLNEGKRSVSDVKHAQEKTIVVSSPVWEEVLVSPDVDQRSDDFGLHVWHKNGVERVSAEEDERVSDWRKATRPPGVCAHCPKTILKATRVEIISLAHKR